MKLSERVEQHFLKIKGLKNTETGIVKFTTLYQIIIFALLACIKINKMKKLYIF